MRSFSANTMWSADAFALVLEEDVVDGGDDGDGDGGCVVVDCGNTVVVEGSKLEVFIVLSSAAEVASLVVGSVPPSSVVGVVGAGVVIFSA